VHISISVQYGTGIIQLILVSEGQRSRSHETKTDVEAWWSHQSRPCWDEFLFIARQHTDVRY